MGFLDNSTTTVDAILTLKGRELLSQGRGLGIVKFALSDEEIDYTLYDVTHPNGTDSYGSVIENMNLLEASPNRTTFNSFLVDQNVAGQSLGVGPLSISNQEVNDPVSIAPSTKNGPNEDYVFTISNTNIIRFESTPLAKSKTANEVKLICQSINADATATVRVIGVQSGLTAIISVQVDQDPGSSNNPDDPQTGNTNGGDGAYSPPGTT